MSTASCGYDGVMSGRAFTLVAVVGLVLGAMCLALAAVVDSAILAVAGTLFVAVVLIAREGWLWRGNLRGWLTTIGALAALVVAAYVVSVST